MELILNQFQSDVIGYLSNIFCYYGTQEHTLSCSNYCSSQGSHSLFCFGFVFLFFFCFSFFLFFPQQSTECLSVDYIIVFYISFILYINIYHLSYIIYSINDSPRRKEASWSVWTWFLHVLWPNCMVSSGIGSYHQVLLGNQEQQQWPV